MGHRTTVRILARWARELDSARARAMIAAYLQSPVELPRDPGPGDARVDLAIPPPTLRALTQITREPVSSSLRRLFALNLGAPRVESVTRTTAELVEGQRDSTIASSGEREQEIRAYDPAAPAGVFQWIWEKLARPNASPNRARAMPFPPAPTKLPDSFHEALDREMARFNSSYKEAAMELTLDPNRWWPLKEAILIVLVLAPVALLIWLILKGGGRASSAPAPLPEFEAWTPIAV
jgi:hypothetical protein